MLEAMLHLGCQVTLFTDAQDEAIELLRGKLAMATDTGLLEVSM